VRYACVHKTPGAVVGILHQPLDLRTNCRIDFQQNCRTFLVTQQVQCAQRIIGQQLGQQIANQSLWHGA
jgi:hypothetical protein